MKSKLVALKDRSIIELRGPDSKEFLQGLISNDIHKIANDKLIYCAMLSPKGRFLYDFFIFEKNEVPIFREGVVTSTNDCVLLIIVKAKGKHTKNTEIIKII